MTEMLQRFNSFRQMMQGKDPKAMVEGLISSGQMSREQYSQLCGMAKNLQNILK